MQRDLRAAHEETCLLLQEKARLILRDKKERLEFLLEQQRLIQEEESKKEDKGISKKDVIDALSRPDERLYVSEMEVETLQQEIKNMEEYPEYLDYIAEFRDLTKESPNEGPVGDQSVTSQRGIHRFIKKTKVVSNRGTLLQKHEEAYGAPLRRWIENYHAVRANGGHKVKRKRQRRARDDEVFEKKVSSALSEASALESEAPISAETHDLTWDRKHCDVLRPRGGYKRCNHFSECLNQRQGKESTEIPAHVLKALFAERKKHSWLRSEDITADHIRLWLRKHQMANWYEHVPKILEKVSGFPAPTIPPSQEQRLKRMFQQAEVAFEKVPMRIRQRHNFLSYDYTIYKIFEVCGLETLLDDFKLLKTDERITHHDQVWKHICSQLNWPFIYTSHY